MKAHELLAPAGAWTQGALARGPNGKCCRPREPKACKWCLRGAMHKVYGRDDITVDNVVDRALIDRGWRHGRAAWNDSRSRTQAEVVALLKELDI
jgi:hypothetical protein